MTPMEYIALLVPAISLGGGAIFWAGLVSQRLRDHVEEDNRRFNELREDLKLIHAKLDRLIERSNG